MADEEVAREVLREKSGGLRQAEMEGAAALEVDLVRHGVERQGLAIARLQASEYARQERAHLPLAHRPLLREKPIDDDIVVDADGTVGGQHVEAQVAIARKFTLRDIDRFGADVDARVSDFRG